MDEKYNVSICILIVSLLLACNRVNENRSVINDFPETIELKGEHIKEVFLQKPETIRIIDSILVILNRDGTHFFEYYHRDNFELLGRYGNKGRGNGEFISPTEIGEFFGTLKDEVIIYTYDWIRRRINYINIHESIINQSYICESELLPDDLANASSIIFNNDSLMGIIPDMDGGSRFIIYNKRERTISHIPFVPDLLKGGVHINNRYFMYTTYGNCVSAKKQYFIASPVGNGQMDFFDFHGNYLKTIYLMDNEHLIEAGDPEDVQAIKDFNLFITDIQIVEDKIHLLFTVLQIPDLKTIRESRIYVFDIDGNPIKEYILNKELHHFTIDPVNRRFLGYSTTGIDGYQLYSFNY